MASLSEVYGMSNTIPLSYVERDHVDKKFKYALDNYGIVVLYGRSKQGKSTLRRKYIKPAINSGIRAIPYCEIRCTDTLTVEEIYERVLHDAGYSLTELQHEKTSAAELGTTQGLSMGIPNALGVSAEKASSTQEQVKQTSTIKAREINYGNINEVISELKRLNYQKLIVLEDFHYLSDDAARRLSIELKHLLEEGFKFLIIGVWVNKVRLNTYNGDLSSRVHYINCTEWTHEELAAVVTKGAKILNIIWGQEVLDFMVKNSMDNIGILQRICHKTCEHFGVFESQSHSLVIQDIQAVQNIVQEIIEEEKDRLDENFSTFSEGLNQSKHELYRWILKYILSSSLEDINAGLHKRTFIKWIHENHPENGRLQNTSLDTALNKIVHLQNRKNNRPPLFDYSGQKIMVVDDYLLLYLKSLTAEEQQELASTY